MVLVNPLLLPEILVRLSCYVPSWAPISSRPRTDDDYEFTPRDLLSCSLVCHLWYSVFYPELWIVYDGEIMSPSTASMYQRRPHHFPVPEELLFAQSAHFRIFTRYTGRIPSYSTSSRFQCRELVDLTLHGTSPQSSLLIQMSSWTLKRLTWMGAIPYSGMLSTLETYYTADLARLESLTLYQWDLSEQALIPILDKNRGTLQKLVLKSVQGLDCIPDGLELRELKELTLEGEWGENTCLGELVKRCPALERLNLEGYLAQSSAAVDGRVMEEPELAKIRAHLLGRQPPLKEQPISYGAADSMTFAIADR
ncbi:hypothetical protein BGZ83_006198 [Gryganskiella cystojenkinii]|nr:hypothetical protein BGZ83_006198 [Gryganskiella cystojenkinii]